MYVFTACGTLVSVAPLSCLPTYDFISRPGCFAYREADKKHDWKHNMGKNRKYNMGQKQKIHAGANAENTSGPHDESPHGGEGRPKAAPPHVAS